VAEELYQLSIPILALEEKDFDKIENGQVLEINEGGEILFDKKA